MPKPHAARMLHQQNSNIMPMFAAQAQKRQLVKNLKCRQQQTQRVTAQRSRLPASHRTLLRRRPLSIGTATKSPASCFFNCLYSRGLPSNLVDGNTNPHIVPKCAKADTQLKTDVGLQRSTSNVTRRKRFKVRPFLTRDRTTFALRTRHTAVIP